MSRPERGLHFLMINPVSSLQNVAAAKILFENKSATENYLFLMG